MLAIAARAVVRGNFARVGAFALAKRSSLSTTPAPKPSELDKGPEDAKEREEQDQEQEGEEEISKTVLTNLGPRKIRRFKHLLKSETEFWKEVEREVEKIPKPVDSSPTFKNVLESDPRFNPIKWFHFFRFAIKQFMYERKCLKKLNIVSLAYSRKDDLELKLAAKRHRTDLVLMLPYFGLFMLPLSYLYLPIFGYITPSIVPFPFLHPAQLVCPFPLFDLIFGHELTSGID